MTMLFRTTHSGQWSIVSLKIDLSTRLQASWGLQSSLLSYCSKSVIGLLSYVLRKYLLLEQINGFTEASDLPLISHPYKLPATSSFLLFHEYSKIFISPCLFACYFLLVSCLSSSLSDRKLSCKRVPERNLSRGFISSESLFYPCSDNILHFLLL